jgi:calcium/calmodulin-dependent protein kinase I
MIQEFFHLSKLSHPNIVHMYEIYIDWQDGFQQTGQVHIIMEKIDGIEMFEVIRNLGHYSETDARLIFS